MLYEAANFYDSALSGFHGLNRNVFVSAVEVHAAGEDVRTRKAFERELSAVGAAANGLHFRLDAGIFHRLLGDIDNEHYRFDFFTHIVVLVVNFNACATGEFVIDFAGEVFEFFFAALEAVAVVIADDVGESGGFYRSVDADEVIEALISFGVFGCFPTGKHYCKLVGNANRVEHLVLSVARVHVKSLESYLSHSGIEVLEFEFAHFAAVHGVSEVGTEEVDIEFVSAEADFFVGIEGDANFAVLDFGVLLQIFYSGDNFGDTALSSAPSSVVPSVTIRS